MQRHFLTEWSAGVDEKSFAYALFELGVSEIRSDQPVMWSIHEDIRPRQSVEIAARRGREILSTYQGLTLVLTVDGSPGYSQLKFAERCDFARTLTSLIEIESALIESGRQWGTATPWRLPLSIGVLGDDPIANDLLERNQRHQQNWPYRFNLVGRYLDRHPILVSSRDARTTLAALPDAPASLKSNLLIVNGLKDGETNVGLNTLWRLASRLSLSGVAFVTEAMGETDFERATNDFAHVLAHDLPIDTVLQRTFGDRVLLYGGRSLWNQARVVKHLGEADFRLRSLPRSAKLEIGKRSLDMLAKQSDAQVLVHGLAKAAAESTLEVPVDAMRLAMRASASEFRFDMESSEASALTELNEAIRKSAAATVKSQKERRFLQQQCFECNDGNPGEPLRKAFVQDIPVRLHVRIGFEASLGWQSSTTSFPDHELPANEASHHLQIMFYAPEHLDEPLLAELILPQTGESDFAKFTFTPKAADKFEGRISVLHRGRVLQTALLSAKVVAERSYISDEYLITLADETEVRHDWTSLERRQKFDLAFVCNHDHSETPRITGVSGKYAWATDLQGIETAVANINAALSKVTNNIDDYTGGLDQLENAKLLVKLAQAGRQLYTRLVHAQLRVNQEGDFDLLNKAITHIQVIDARLDALVPLEFVYDYNLPPLGVPTLCPQHLEALAVGTCKETCPGQTSNKHVCPMGFWGVRKVIERHAFDTKRAQPGRAPLIVQSEVTALRERIDVREGAVMGHSKRVKVGEIKPLFEFVKEKSSGKVVLSTGWEDWAGAVTANSPAFLIAFPHSALSGGDRTLELGGVPLTSGNLDHFTDVQNGNAAGNEWYVRSPTGEAPLVLLLGCDTRSAAENYGSHVTAFRQAGAAVVVATIATVAATHAVRVGSVLTKEIMARATETDDEKTPTRKFVGEALRDAKRKALSESLLMALAVVGYGDADWRI